MKNSIFLALLCLALAACDFRGSVGVGTVDVRKMESRGITFLVPLETSSASEGDAGFRFEGETVKAETRGDVLYVAGQSYGILRRGDIVDLSSPGKVLINGLEKQQTPSGGTPESSRGPEMTNTEQGMR